MKIFVKKLNKNLELPKIIGLGEWVDLRAACDYAMVSPFAHRLSKNKTIRNVEFDNGIVPLGVAMKIPEGYEAILAPRSSAFKNYGILQTNGIGVIDSTYCGNEDEWGLPVVALRSNYIKEGDRICQFRIQLSQKATILQKLRWLFDNKIEFIEVDNLSDPSRGGFGKGTGV